MSTKDDNIFVTSGLSEQDVRQWQKEKKLEHVKDKALVQLYSRVVLKKQLKKPYPIYPIKKIWEEIEAINSGQRTSTSRKLFVGIKDAVVIGLLGSISYVGCPKCLKGAKKIGASKCAGHGTELVDLVELSWNEWLVYEDESEFTIKMSPTYMNEYNELNMSGAKLYVEGVIDLDADPIKMMVTNVRDFEPGTLMMGAMPVEQEGDDFTVGRDDVDFAGFEDEEEAEKLPDENPFLDKDDVEEISNAPAKNGVSDEFKRVLRTEFEKMLKVYATNPVKRVQVEKYMLGWISERYPMEFSDDKEAMKKLWEITSGLYEPIGEDKIKRLS